jgi:hypothetical protein
VRALTAIARVLPPGQPPAQGCNTLRGRQEAAQGRAGASWGGSARRAAWRPRRELLLASAQHVATPLQCGGDGRARRAWRPLQRLRPPKPGLRNHAPFSAAACAPAPQPRRSTCLRPAKPTGQSRPPTPPGPPPWRPRGKLCQAPPRSGVRAPPRRCAPPVHAGSLAHSSRSRTPPGDGARAVICRRCTTADKTYDKRCCDAWGALTRQSGARGCSPTGASYAHRPQSPVSRACLDVVPNPAAFAALAAVQASAVRQTRSWPSAERLRAAAARRCGAQQPPPRVPTLASPPPALPAAPARPCALQPAAVAAEAAAGAPPPPAAVAERRRAPHAAPPPACAPQPRARPPQMQLPPAPAPRWQRRAGRAAAAAPRPAPTQARAPPPPSPPPAGLSAPVAAHRPRPPPPRQHRATPARPAPPRAAAAETRRRRCPGRGRRLRLRWARRRAHPGCGGGAR